jgi:hypothetical protein
MEQCDDLLAKLAYASTSIPAPVTTCADGYPGGQASLDPVNTPCDPLARNETFV